MHNDKVESQILGFQVGPILLTVRCLVTSIISHLQDVHVF